MKILSNQNNLIPLKEAINSAEKELFICSAWIRGEKLKSIFSKSLIRKIQSKEVKIRIIVRIGTREDVIISGSEMLSFVEKLGDGCEFRYHKTLHTKLYIVDDKFAAVGSFNLTGGGFGTEDYPGNNIETGIEFAEPENISKLKETFENIWNECKPIDRNLLGFTLNETTSNEFSLIGIKPIEAGKFIQINESPTEIILGQVLQSKKNNPLFYQEPVPGTPIDINFQNAFSSQNHFNNHIAGIAESSTVPSIQLNIGHVKILSRINIEDKKVKGSDMNRFAPDVACEVYDADPQILEDLFGHKLCNPAVMISNREVKVGLNPAEILTRHMAIFGSTGSGKSYFAKTLIADHLKKWVIRENGRIIILDPHGEYAKDFQNSGKDDFGNVIPPENIIPNNVDLQEVKAKVVEDVEDLIDVCELSQLKKQQINFLEDCLIQSKGDTKQFIDRLKLLNKTNNKNDQININWDHFVSRYIDGAFYKFLGSFETIAKEIAEHEMPGAKPAEKNPRVTELVNKMYDSLPASERSKIKAQVIKNQVINFEKQFSKETAPVLSDDIIDAIEHAECTKKFRLEPYNFISKVKAPGIYCINLQQIDEDAQKYELAADILKGAFERAKSTGNFKTLFVIEEAHNFAPEMSRKSNPAYKALKKIASEGRKFNVGLLVITQRPAYVSKDILSQCNTQAIFRLINKNDIDAVKNTVEGISEQEVYRLPNYVQGQCLLTGVAIKEPVVVKISRN